MTIKSKQPPETPLSDKEERRAILSQSLDNLVEFHKVERDEKLRTFAFYTAFLTGALAIVFGIPFLVGANRLDESRIAEVAIIKLIALTVIVILTLLVIKKLIASRINSNNIYAEYGQRLEYLVETHSDDLDDDGKQKLRKSLNRYYGRLVPKSKILSAYSADTHEVFGLWVISIVLSLSSIIPISELVLGKLANLFQSQSSAHMFVYFLSSLYVLTNLLVGLSILMTARRSPGTEID